VADAELHLTSVEPIMDGWQEAIDRAVHGGRTVLIDGGCPMAMIVPIPPPAYPPGPAGALAKGCGR
jgi:hypothetical protein